MEETMKIVAMVEYEEARECYVGWCPTCEDFTRPMTEPDAHDYDCPVCDGHGVVGAEDALMEGLIEIDDSDGEGV